MRPRGRISMTTKKQNVGHSVVLLSSNLLSNPSYHCRCAARRPPTGSRTIPPSVQQRLGTGEIINTSLLPVQSS